MKRLDVVLWACVSFAELGVGRLSAVQAQARPTRPELLSVPSLPLPQQAESVELILEVAPDGHASVEACEGEGPACAVARDALQQARFAPAERDGEAIRSRIRFRYTFDEGSPAPEARPTQEEGAIAEGVQRPGTAELGVVARVEATRQTSPAGSTRISAEEARDQPGALGDPFRALGALPGFIPFQQGLPYFFIRGAPPQSTVHRYDGIPLPALFHVLALPAVVHPRMLGDLTVHRGVAPSRWGRRTGAVIDASAGVLGDGAVGEAELRLLDASGYASYADEDLQIAGAARLGYPGYFLGAIVDGGFASYADYQVRGSVAIGRGGQVRRVSRGPHDRLDLPAAGPLTGVFSNASTELTFHRGEVRLLHQRGEVELGAALRYGVDHAWYRSHASRENVRLEVGLGGARTWLTYRTENTTLRAGATWVGRSGDFTRTEAVPDRLLFHFPASVRRIHGAAHVEMEWRPTSSVQLDVGARGDLHFGVEGTEASADPRLRLTLRPDPHWDLTLAAGTAHAPVFFGLPVPGFSEVPVMRGLSKAWQSELGVRWAGEGLGGQLRGRVEVTAFLHRHEGLLSPSAIELSSGCDGPVACFLVAVASQRRDQWVAGAEALGRVQVGGYVHAQLSYSFTHVDADPLFAELEHTPSWAIQHAFSLLLGYDSRDGFTVGARGFLRSGAARNFYWTDPDISVPGLEDVQHDTEQLPWYGTMDVSVAYEWDAGWARLRVSAEWLNVTFPLGGEPAGFECAERGPPRGCTLLRADALYLPNAGLRATFE
ncbi:MAG: TonB-dependent receptor [Sandaracinaceae bacterium]